MLRLYTRSDDQNLYVSVAVAGESTIALGAKVVLVTDLINDARRKRRLPTELMTPTVDKLQQQGIAAYPFPPQSSQRFHLKTELATTP